MTNEEAIVVLQKIKPIPHRGDGKSITHTLEIIAIDKAIKTLEQQPYEDCISRQRVLDIINFEYKWLLDAKVYDICTSIAFSAIMSKISEMPSVTPTRPTGKWIDIGDEGLVFKCSICGTKKTIESHFCPNCGTRLEVEDEADN